MTLHLPITASRLRWWGITLAIFCLLAILARPASADAPPDITWTTGPANVNLGSVATLQLPKGYRFTDAHGARTFMELTKNIPNGGELGILIPPDDSTADWFVVFRFDEVGYVRDDETLNDSTVDSILESVRKNTEASNTEKVARGWGAMHIDGWFQRPFYDSVTHCLTWAIKANSSSGSIVNFDSRVLGRRGVLNAKLVIEPDKATTAIADLQNTVKSITFAQGGSYAEFRSGDKIAEYGLVGLMTGGAAVVAIKLWKPLLIFGAAVVGSIGAGIRKIKKFFTGNKQ